MKNLTKYDIVMGDGMPNSKLRGSSIMVELKKLEEAMKCTKEKLVASGRAIGEMLNKAKANQNS